MWRDKPIEEFRLGTVRKDGTRGRYAKCRKCEQKRNTAWRKRHPERERVKQREWVRENRFAAALITSRVAARRNGYQPCIATKEELALAFTGHCHVCNLPEEENGKRLATDHCHVTGKFRGFLCDRCNKALGYVDDSRERLLSMAEYLN